MRLLRRLFLRFFSKISYFGTRVPRQGTRYKYNFNWDDGTLGLATLKKKKHKNMSSSSLVASAEELLKTRSIPDLRELVQTLEIDAVSKVSELQSMVGSKYHDFIQSADAISAMQQKSEYLEGNLKKFLVLAQEVSGHTHELLEHTSVGQANKIDISKTQYLRGISHKGKGL